MGLSNYQPVPGFAIDYFPAQHCCLTLWCRFPPASRVAPGLRLLAGNRTLQG